MTIWLTSDWHLWHENIIRYCNRPFASAKEMNEAILTNYNELVKPQDHVYNLGDLTMLRGSQGSQQGQMFIKEMKKFNGHKRLILGNHDHFLPRVYIDAGFEKIVGTGRWFDGLLLSHYPVHPTSIGTGLACVHGHTHDHSDLPPIRSMGRDGNPEIIRPYVNVCVDRTEFKPISLEDVKVRVAEAIRNAVEEEVMDIPPLDI